MEDSKEKAVLFCEKRTKKLLLCWAWGVGRAAAQAPGDKVFCFFLFTKRSA